MLKPHPPRAAHESPLVSRRAVVTTLTLGVAAVAGLATPRLRAADSTQKVDIHDPKAVALGYVENAGQVDRKKYPQFIAGSNCENCLQLQGKPGNDYRPCGLFSGGLVSVSGWCTGWAAEM
jgi:hypothetical protein